MTYAKPNMHPVAALWIYYLYLLQFIYDKGRLLCLPEESSILKHLAPLYRKVMRTPEWSHLGATDAARMRCMVINYIFIDRPKLIRVDHERCTGLRPSREFICRLG